MQGSRECCPVCVRIPELFVWFPTAVRYANKCCVTSHDTSTGLLGTFQASNIGEWYTKKLFRSSSIILATLNFWWEFPFNDMIQLLTCEHSGHLLKTNVCPLFAYKQRQKIGNARLQEYWPELGTRNRHITVNAFKSGHHLGDRTNIWNRKTILIQRIGFTLFCFNSLIWWHQTTPSSPFQHPVHRCMALQPVCPNLRKRTIKSWIALR